MAAKAELLKKALLNIESYIKKYDSLKKLKPELLTEFNEYFPDNVNIIVATTELFDNKGSEKTFSSDVCSTFSYDNYYCVSNNLDKLRPEINRDCGGDRSSINAFSIGKQIIKLDVKPQFILQTIEEKEYQRAPKSILNIFVGVPKSYREFLLKEKEAEAEKNKTLNRDLTIQEYSEILITKDMLDCVMSEIGVSDMNEFQELLVKLGYFYDWGDEEGGADYIYNKYS